MQPPRTTPRLVGLARPALGVLLLAACARADEVDLNALSLDDLMNIKVDISSNRETSIREQPGIVSVITADAIRRQGARDLMDVLQLVPGYQFGTDIGGVVGPIFRGLWAYEGKTQLIVDGVEMNEGAFGTIQLNRHFPAELIEQIEIIRGPGSALYGGTAELSVIRITTKGAKLNGAQLVSTPAVTDEEISQQHSIAAGYQLPRDWWLSLSASYRDDYLSNETYTDLDGDSYDLSDTSLEPYSVNLGVGWKDFEARFLYDYYDVTAYHSIGDVVSLPRSYSFETRAFLAKYDLKPTDWLTITPKVVYKQQDPWRRTRISGGVKVYQAVPVDRLTGSVAALAQINDKSSVLVGVESYQDKGEVVRGSVDLVPDQPGTQREVDYADWAVFSQYELQTSLANLTLGGRYEEHDALEDGSFVPRVGLTRVWDKFHAKALYSEAFRTPNVRVVADADLSGGPLEAEKTRSYEVELGYQIDKSWALVGNVFHTTVEGPYLYNPSTGRYVHEGEVSTYGLELELKHVADWGQASLGYSFYQPDRNTVPFFDAADDDTLLGAPNHKLTGSITYQVNKHLSWNVNSVFQSEARAYSPPAGAIAGYDAEVFFNTFLEYAWERLSLGAGVNDIFDSGRLVHRPYFGDDNHGPLPEKGREFYVRAAYKF